LFVRSQNNQDSADSSNTISPATGESATANDVPEGPDEINSEADLAAAGKLLEASDVSSSPDQAELGSQADF